MAIPAWISRLLPSRPAGRARNLRRFDAAQATRLLHSWNNIETNINRELRGDLDALRGRARDLAKNEPMARRYLAMVAANVVGPTGFTLQSRAAEGDKQDTLAQKAIEDGWADWSLPKNCDLTGRMSFSDMSSAIIKGIARDGEALVRVRQGAANKYRYALQLLDIERLDTTFHRAADGTKNAVIMGVEINADGRPVAYWLRAAKYGNQVTGTERQRVPASELMHLFVTEDPEQVRGYSWMHAVMIRVRHMKGFQEAAIVAAQVGASQMGFFTNPDGNPDPLKDGEDAAGMPFFEAAPGQFGMLPPGYDFKSFNPDYPSAYYDAFVKAAKRDISSGLNVSYHGLANDLEGVNFSSIRAGTLEERDQWINVQEWMVGAFFDPVFAQWLDSALLAGALVQQGGSRLPAVKLEKFLMHKFQGRRWQWVDPLKDIEASVKGMENGLASPYTIAGQQGVDADDVLDDIARFRQKAKDKGVELASPNPAPPPPPPKSDEPAPADEGSKAIAAAILAVAAREPGSITVNTPAVNVSSPVNIAEGAVRVDAPITTPEPRVTLEASITVPERSVTVNSAPAQVEVLPAPQVATKEDVTYDDDGNIKTIVRRPMLN